MHCFFMHTGTLVYQMLALRLYLKTSVVEHALENTLIDRTVRAQHKGSQTKGAHSLWARHEQHQAEKI